MNQLLVGLALIAAAPALKDPPVKPATIEGDWTVRSSVVGGKSDGVMEKSPIDKIVITAEKWQVVRGGQPSHGTNLFVDPKKDPPHMDIGDGGKGTVCKAIYKLDGDTLTICYVLSGERPTKIESPEGSQVRMMVLKRIQK
jgi:uncharacterized protein (TIGR03067 family)